MKMEVKLKDLLKYYLGDPEDLDRLTVVRDKNGEYWLESIDIDEQNRVIRSRENLMEILKDCLRNPWDIYRIRIVKGPGGEFWVETKKSNPNNLNMPWIEIDEEGNVWEISPKAIRSEPIASIIKDEEGQEWLVPRKRYENEDRA